MIRLALLLALITSAANAGEKTEFYGPNKGYQGHSITRQNGIEDFYDKDGNFTGRSVAREQGDKTVKQFYGKNLGKPTGSELTKRH